MDAYFSKLDKAIEPNKYVIPNSKNIDKMFPSNNEYQNTKNLTKSEKSKKPNNLQLCTTTTSKNEQPRRALTINSKAANNNARLFNPSSTVSNDNISLTQIEIDDSNAKALFILERKKNLQYRYEVTNLKNKVESLKKALSEKENEVTKLKIESEKDRNYLINLEKIISEYKEKMPKLKYGQNSTSKILNENTKTSNNLNSNNKRSLTSPLKIKSINLLPNQNLSPNCQQNPQNSVGDGFFPAQNPEILNNMNSNIYNELTSLQKFKSEIFAISKKNDEININIFNTLKKIEELFYNIQQIYKENNTKIPNELQGIYSIKYDTLEEIKNNYDKIMSSITESLQSKHEEYSCLLNAKDEEINILLEEIQKLKNEKNELSDKLYDESQKISNLKSENEFIKIRDSVNTDNNFKLNQSMNKKKLDDYNYKNKIEPILKPIKDVVISSIGRIKKNFDMGDMDNNDFVNNINSQIE